MTTKKMTKELTLGDMIQAKREIEDAMPKFYYYISPYMPERGIGYRLETPEGRRFVIHEDDEDHFLQLCQHHGGLAIRTGKIAEA